jgi:1-aminocyclopropane-1-carboxylate deaminase/D-cysteine desulfhydrase-like pyridoxal-dependent ACC family enzyme
MAALIADRRSGRLPAGQPTVFVHTGGLPSLFADRFRAWFTV